MLKQCSTVALLIGIVGCRATNEQSQTLALEDSLTICSDLQDLAVQESSNRPLDEAYRLVKARERRILDDLIVTSEPNRRPGYERQRQRLEACSKPQATATEEMAVKTRNEEKRQTLQDEILNIGSLSDLCRVAETTMLKHQPTDSCKNDLLNTACYRVTGGRAGNASLTEAVMGEYRVALLGCVRSLAGEEAAIAAETFATELKTELDGGGDLGHSILLAACRSGAKVAGNRIADVPHVDYNNACGALSKNIFNDRSRISSCLRTATDICSIFIGKGGMQLDRLIPGDTDPGIQEDLLRQLYQGIDQAICEKNPTGSLACRTIGAAAEQIMQAVQTGNNDWAHCVGTAQLGACLGTLWGAGGWTNNSGVATAKTNKGITYRPCCWCHKDYYADDGWLSDTRYRRENWFGVIQDGDVATGNCKQMQNKNHAGMPNPAFAGYKTYYNYSECGKWFVAGDSCHADDGQHQVWDAKKKQWFKVTVP